MRQWRLCLLLQKKQRIEPILYMTEWFMCLFSRTLPWATVLRVWDMFFCEGALFCAHSHVSSLRDHQFCVWPDLGYTTTRAVSFNVLPFQA